MSHAGRHAVAVGESGKERTRVKRLGRVSLATAKCEVWLLLCTDGPNTSHAGMLANLTIIALGGPVWHLATGKVHARIIQQREAEAAKIKGAKPKRHGEVSL